MCLYTDDIALIPGHCAGEDINTPVESPLNGPLCIGEDEYFAIFDHELGPDCLAGTADDGPKDPKYCPPQYEYNEEVCACSLRDCFSLCLDALYPNPLECGDCITKAELDALNEHEGLDD